MTIDHASRAHSVLGASSADRWTRCPASVNLTKDLPDSTSDFAQDGTEAHELIDYCLKNSVRSAADGLKASGQVWTHRADDLGERLWAVQEALDHVYKRIDTYGTDNCVLLTEQKFALDLKAAPNQAFGTGDICIYTPVFNTLYVEDYKHGAGVPVDIYDPEDPDGFNRQLMFYLLGVYEFFIKNGREVDNMVITIIQPRARHHSGETIRSAVVPMKALHKYKELLEASAAAALGENPEFNPGEKQCRWCKAKMFCEARKADRDNRLAKPIGFASVSVIEPKALPAPDLMSLDDLRVMKRILDELDDYRKEIDSFMFDKLKRGEPVPGFKLVEARAITKWNKTPAEVLESLKKQFPELDPALIMPPALVTLTEAKRVLAEEAGKSGTFKTKKAAAEFVNQQLAELTLKSSSGNLSMVAESNEKPAWSPTSVFDDVTVIPKLETTLKESD